MAEIKGFYDVKDIELNIKYELKNDMAIINLAGNLTTYNSQFFMGRVDLIIKSGIKKYIFDMSGVKYVSSTGIGAFTSILRDLDKFVPKGEMVLCGVQPKVFEIFNLLGFTSFFRYFDNQNIAENHFMKNIVSIFPKILMCPACQHKLKATKSGRFKCSTCKSIIVIDSDGKLFKE